MLIDMQVAKQQMKEAGALSRDFNFFEKYDVILLKDYRSEHLKKGDRVMVMPMPNQLLYLINPDGRCFEEHATQGVHFKFAGESDG